MSALTAKERADELATLVEYLRPQFSAPATLRMLRLVDEVLADLREAEAALAGQVAGHALTASQLSTAQRQLAELEKSWAALVELVDRYRAGDAERDLAATRDARDMWIRRAEAAEARLQELAKLAYRGGHPNWCKASFPPVDSCTCGADEHNAKVEALLGEGRP